MEKIIEKGPVEKAQGIVIDLIKKKKEDFKQNRFLTGRPLSSVCCGIKP